MAFFRVLAVIEDNTIAEKDGGRLRLEPGDKVTAKRLLALGQKQDDIDNLVACGALAAEGK